MKKNLEEKNNFKSHKNQGGKEHRTVNYQGF